MRCWMPIVGGLLIMMVKCPRFVNRAATPLGWLSETIYTSRGDCSVRGLGAIRI